jgi:DNA polymerase III epsilon subunit-like protein
MAAWNSKDLYDDGLETLVVTFAQCLNKYLIIPSELPLAISPKNPAILQALGSQETLVNLSQDNLDYKKLFMDRHMNLREFYHVNLLLQDTMYCADIAPGELHNYGHKYMTPTTVTISPTIYPFMIRAMDSIKSKERFNIVSWDVETTGVSVEKDYIVSLAVVIHCPILATQCIAFHTLINPDLNDFVMPKKAYKIHGIHERDLDGKPTLWAIAGFIKWALHDKFVIGHNSMDFDMQILKKELTRVGCARLIPKPAIHVDTYQLMRRCFRSESASLRNAFKIGQQKVWQGKVLLPWDESKAHDALWDALKALETFTMLCAPYNCNWRNGSYSEDFDQCDWTIMPWASGSKESFERLCLFQNTNGDIIPALLDKYWPMVSGLEETMTSTYEL